MANFKYGDITEKLIGAAYRIHRTLKNGFQEVIYQRALELEFKQQNIGFAREFEMPGCYSDEQIGTSRVDILAEYKISVELKAIIKREDVHLAKATNYLEAYSLGTGLLSNFGAGKLKFHRFTNKKLNPAIIHHPIISYQSH